MEISCVGLRTGLGNRDGKSSYSRISVRSSWIYKRKIKRNFNWCQLGDSNYLWWLGWIEKLRIADSEEGYWWIFGWWSQLEIWVWQYRESLQEMNLISNKACNHDCYLLDHCYLFLKISLILIILSILSKCII